MLIYRLLFIQPMYHVSVNLHFPFHLPFERRDTDWASSNSSKTVCSFTILFLSLAGTKLLYDGVADTKPFRVGLVGTCTLSSCLKVLVYHTLNSNVSRFWYDMI